MTTTLIAHIEGLGLGAVSELLLTLSRPSIELVAGDGPVTPACSKFGGTPDLPVSFSWPMHERGPYRFIGQVNLSEIGDVPHELPRNGLLSFFYAHDQDGESFWGDPNYVRVFYSESVTGLGPVEPPESVRLGVASRVGFKVGLDVPPWPWDESAGATWPVEASLQDAYWDLRCRIHPSGRYLLGYPFNTTLAYDPTPGPGWHSLLTLSSDDELEWGWHDGDWLVTFIEDDRLRAGDFSRIEADAG